MKRILAFGAVAMFAASSVGCGSCGRRTHMVTMPMVSACDTGCNTCPTGSYVPSAQYMPADGFVPSGSISQPTLAPQ